MTLDLVIKIIELIIQAIIGGGLLWVAFEANKIAKINNKRLSSEERGKIEEILEKIQFAESCIAREGCANDEAINSMFSAEVLSKLYLPEDDYLKVLELSKKIRRMWYLHRQIFDRQGNPINVNSDKRTEHIEEEHNHLIEISEFDSTQLFSKFLGIKVE